MEESKRDWSSRSFHKNKRIFPVIYPRKKTKSADKLLDITNAIVYRKLSKGEDYLVKICDGIKEGQKIQYIQGMKPSRFKENPTAVNDGRPAPISDGLEISPRFPDMKKIHQILAPVPEIRMEKVAELKKTIVGGTYEVRAEDIADKMIREVILELNR